MTTPIRYKTVRADALSVVDLANLYLEEVYRRAIAAQVTWGHYHSVEHRLKRACESIGEDSPLASIGKAELLAAVLRLAARPPARPRPFQTQPHHEPISLVTAKEAIGQLKYLFLWASEHDALDWSLPKGFARIFKLKDKRLKTPAEMERESRQLVSGEVETYTTPELARLFRAARQRERLYILLGLNLGFTSSEVANLRTFEVFLDGESSYVHKRRNKTGVEARWRLWPETAALLRRLKAPDNPERRWVLSGEGNALVEVNELCRRDAIDQAWKSLHRRVPDTRWLGFRFLRKTGADAIKRLGGLEESEMFLAHQEPGLNKAYANRNWNRMWRCLEAFRAELPFLGPSWDLAPEECLFTQIAWGDIEAPHSQRVTKRSALGRLNVSFNKRKKKFYVRVYRDGRTHWGGYFETEEAADRAALEIRLRLDGIGPLAIPRENIVVTGAA